MNRLPRRRVNAKEPGAIQSQTSRRTRGKQPSTAGTPTGRSVNNPTERKKGGGRRPRVPSSSSDTGAVTTGARDGGCALEEEEEEDDDDDDVARLVRTVCSRIVLRDDGTLLADGHSRHPSGGRGGTNPGARPAHAPPTRGGGQDRAVVDRRGGGGDGGALPRGRDLGGHPPKAEGAGGADGRRTIESRRRSVRSARERERLRAEARSRLDSMVDMTREEVASRTAALRREGRARVESFGRARDEIRDCIEILGLHCEEISARQAEYERSLEDAERKMTSEAQDFLDFETARVTEELRRALDSLDLSPLASN